MDESNKNKALGNLEGREEFLFKAEACLDQSSPEKAFALAQERLDLFPGDVDARIVIGSSLVEMGKMEEAIEVLKGVKDDILEWSRIFEYLGDIYREKGLAEEAIKNYQNFISLNSALPIAEDVSEKLNSIIDSSHPDAVSDEVEGGAEHISPGFHTITLAKLYMKQGHLEMAKKVLEEIFRVDAGNIKVAEMLRDVEAMLDGGTPKTLSEEKKAFVIDELNKWLENISKMKRYAAR